ncbi:response regulator [Jiella sp. M17.18]|uniref:response regulator n=1 Tax=Jiella sp. M17.18 TaxID=3234247 RepID=UPI0034E00F34
MRLLMVEDNRALSDWLARLLRSEKFVVDCVADGETAVEGADLDNYDLVIVDLGLPGMSGIEVIRRLRARRSSVPILVLTAEGALARRVEGLDAGADDYLTKPFEVEELTARIRALMRRSAKTLREELTFGALVFDQNRLVFSVAGEDLQLSRREHVILEALIRRAGAAVSKEVLLESSYGHEEDVNLSAIEVIVHRLRRKLEHTGIAIATLRGIGYVLRQDKP